MAFYIYICLYAMIAVVVTASGLDTAYDERSSKNKRRRGARVALCGWAWLPVGIVIMCVIIIKTIIDLFRIAEIKGSK